MSSWRHLLLLTTLSLTVSACQSLSPLKTEDKEAESQAHIAVQSGDFSSAARQYEALAETKRGTYRTQLYIQAASAHWQLGQIEQVQANLAMIDFDHLTDALAFYKDILEANISFSQQNYEGALASLSSYKAENLSSKKKKALFRMRISAYQETENWLEKAKNHILLAPLLTELGRDKNQQQLWKSLMALSPKTLELFNPGTAPADDSGWFMLAHTIQTYIDKPKILSIAIEDWERNYPNHPALPWNYIILASKYKESVSSAYLLPKKPKSIAILLPESGPYTQVAEAIKQGIFAAHFTENTNTHTKLHFINTQTGIKNDISMVKAAYEQALKLNASIVIGPLDKTAIEILAESSNLTIPVIALNHLPISKQVDNLYQFGLAPEDDAISAAKNAMAKGYKRAVIFSPNAEWGHRAVSAFKKQWLTQGGVLLSQAIYNEDEHDYSSVITPVFDLSLSEQRYESLKRTLTAAIKIDFDPRRRQDIDIIFLIARPLKARQLVPQFKFHRSGQLPVIATSHAYTGAQNKQQDIDLNGLYINDIPWVFPEMAHNDLAYRAIKKQQPPTFNQLIRLYALGADAYRLATQINLLSLSSDMNIKGATGLLSVDDRGYINRRLQWATFVRGKIKALDNPSAGPSFPKQ
tara:strand:- start:883 stop:2799 length:1917 start_codon:yes stop_codon:yes gene_type:complete